LLIHNNKKCDERLKTKDEDSTGLVRNHLIE